MSKPTETRKKELGLMILATIVKTQVIANSLIRTDIDTLELDKINNLATLGNDYAKYFAEYFGVETKSKK